MKRIIKIDGKEMEFVANARVPRIYRNEFGRDLLIDMKNLTEGYEAKLKKKQEYPFELLTIFENVAWVFAKEGGNDVGASPDEWLETLSMLSIYEILPEILKMWSELNKTTSSVSSKK